MTFQYVLLDFAEVTSEQSNFGRRIEQAAVSDEENV